MTEQKKFTSLADLRQMFPEAEQSRPASADANLAHDGKGRTVRVRKETQGRKGKTVTLIEGLHHNPRTMDEIARILKQHCGAGGTVKPGVIEIQGDQRKKVAQKLREMNYVIRE